MPTVFSHCATGLIASKISNAGASDTKLTITCAALAAFPDVDALFRGWFRDDQLLAHRGLTHSVFFACAIGFPVAFFFKRAFLREASALRLWALFSLTMASHGFFDAMTDGGSGIAFFAPFNNSRYFLPWRPIPVAPLSAGQLLTTRGVHVLVVEMALFWTFAAGAALWGSNLARKSLAGVFFTAGLVAWTLALP